MTKRVSGVSRPIRALLVFALVLGTAGLTQAAGPNPGDNPTRTVGPALRGLLEFYPNGTANFTGTCTNVPVSVSFAVDPALYDDVGQERDLVGSVGSVSLLDMPEGCQPPNTDLYAPAYLLIVSAWAGQIIDYGAPGEHWQANVVAMFYLE